MHAWYRHHCFTHVTNHATPFTVPWGQINHHGRTAMLRTRTPVWQHCLQKLMWNLPMSMTLRAQPRVLPPSCDGSILLSSGAHNLWRGQQRGKTGTSGKTFCGQSRAAPPASMPAFADSEPKIWEHIAKLITSAPDNTGNLNANGWRLIGHKFFNVISGWRLNQMAMVMMGWWWWWWRMKISYSSKTFSPSWCVFACATSDLCRTSILNVDFEYATRQRIWRILCMTPTDFFPPIYRVTILAFVFFGSPKWFW